jgi:hypothetical protein
MMIGFNGGLIGEKRTTSANASIPGVWTANEQSIARSAANGWPSTLTKVIPDQLALELDAALYSGSGNTWADSSGNNRDATLINNPTYISNSFGGIFEFVRDNGNYGASPYVTNTNVARNYTQPYTVTITFRPRSLRGDMRLFGQANTINEFSSGFHNWNSSVTPQTIQFRMYLQGNWAYPPTTMVFNPEQWYQVACVYTSNAYTTMYLNATSYGTVGPANSQFSRMDIGVRQNNQFGDPFDGDVAHFMIHYKALSASEVSHNFNALRGRFGI